MCYSGTVHGTLGNVPRNSLDAPGVLEWDVTLKKDTKVGEGKNVEFRAEFFNIINHPMFNAPAFSIFSSTDTRADNAGQITSTSRRPRQIQFALKFTF
jgi:hypothetical protein